MFIGILIVAFDQISKHYIVSNFNLGETKPIIDGIFSLTYIQNTGGAFGFMSGAGFMWFFIVFSILAIGALVYYCVIQNKKQKSKMLMLSVTFILGGAVGNLIDRVYLSYVIDFLEPAFMNFAIFNVADCFVVIGACLLCLNMILSDKGKV